MELKRLTTMGKSFGLPMEIISPRRAEELFPLMSTDGVLAAAFLPTDGYIDPASVTQAIAKGARMRNARICEHTTVTSITVDGRRATTVHTVDADGERHDIRCEIVVNAAGMWGMEIGRMAGVRIPAVAVEHQYVLTGPIADFAPAELQRMPTMDTLRRIQREFPDLQVTYHGIFSFLVPLLRWLDPHGVGCWLDCADVRLPWLRRYAFKIVGVGHNSVNS